MKLNAREVNVLKAAIEGNSLVNLYNRLEWDMSKSIRLNTEEKDTLSEMIESPYNTGECIDLLKKLLGR